MAVAKPSIELCKGSNGLEKVVLKEARGSSVEALGWDFVLEISVQDLLLCTLDLVLWIPCLRDGRLSCTKESLAVSHRWHAMCMTGLLQLLVGACVCYTSSVFACKGPVYLPDIAWWLTVYLYGAHVTSWKNDHGEELLFVSSKVMAFNWTRPRLMPDIEPYEDYIWREIDIFDPSHLAFIRDRLS
ncbi:hypothetical protein M5K25_026800 [Dendrobium thyrsiflorum]|uniref:Uncharacterized protein n=1 Tax=Dendrobium thyrsiflorum TaxID=117978 RepID=A0ABD0TYM7_DENTH